MDKREQIEGVLRGLAKSYTPFPDWALFLPQIAQTFADQAILIECEVGHDHYAIQQGMRVRDYTSINYPKDFYSMIHVEGHHGTPGKALAIILSEE